MASSVRACVGLCAALCSSTDDNGIKRIVYSMSGGHMLKRGHV